MYFTLYDKVLSVLAGFVELFHVHLMPSSINTNIASVVYFDTSLIYSRRHGQVIWSQEDMKVTSLCYILMYFTQTSRQFVNCCHNMIKSMWSQLLPMCFPISKFITFCIRCHFSSKLMLFWFLMSHLALWNIFSIFIMV